jgi:hypothetical protein
MRQHKVRRHKTISLARLLKLTLRLSLTAEWKPK